MTATLSEALLAPDTRPLVVTDCEELIKNQVSGMSGISGAAIKVAYKTVNVFSAGHIRYTIDSNLPDMASELEPYWKDFSASGGTDFGAYLAEHGNEVAEALLSITDARAKSPTSRPTVTKAYGAVRDKAAKHVVAALPQVGSLVQKRAG